MDGLQVAIRPTVTQQVRKFLAAQGVELRPWSSLDEVYLELYSLLHERRDDPSFWGPLEELLGQVVRGSVDPAWPGRLPAPQAELLSSADLGELAAELRAALGRGGEGGVDHGALHRLTAGVSAAVLGAFLLLGVAAAGCSSGDQVAAPPASETAAQGPRPAPPQPPPPAPPQPVATPDQTAADAAQAPQPQAEVCALDRSSLLWTTVDASALADPAKRDLCVCLAGASETWTQGLTRLFERGTPAQVAAALERLVVLCGQDGALAGDYSAVTDPALRLRRPRVRIADPQVAYRGVTFP